MKTKRRTVVTLEQLNRANQTVTREMMALGLWTHRLHHISVLLAPRGVAHGWQWYEGDRSIRIAARSRARLKEALARKKRTPLRDVLRHEWAHALASVHRAAFRSRHFRAAFGGAHGWDFSWLYDPAHHVSTYAATATSEDFAETFMFYLKHRGQLPARFDTPVIRRKWRFIAALAQRLRRYRQTYPFRIKSSW
jgi:hypothetical protein